MSETTLVNLHCHSHLSDGDLAPAEVVGYLAANGVRVAALTDHDTIDGTAAFREAAVRREIGCIPGIELSVAGPNGGELHLLGYGFDPDCAALLAALKRLRSDKQGARRQNLAENIQDALPYMCPRDDPGSPETHPTTGLIHIADGIALLHEAGGLVFLAHPLAPGHGYTLETLEQLLVELKQAGLDGVEAIYSQYDHQTRAALVALARKHGLLVSAGSDFHSVSRPGLAEAGIEMPNASWRQFRDALFDRRNEVSARAQPERMVEKRKPGFSSWNSLVVRIVVPTALAIILFVFSLYQIIIPAFERNLLDRKREMIRELTTLACGILSDYDRQAREGRISLQQAQAAAAQSIQTLRYGKEGKDYFWITDERPFMIMHPYQSVLNGKDVSDYRDQRGVRIFVEFANALRNKEDDYVEYVWQWKDDPERQEIKQSFIKKFAPWGWIIGTGIYVEDVRREIQQLESRMVHISLVITAVSALLLVFVVLQSTKIEIRRRRTAEDLHASHEKYRALVEASTDGIAMILDGRFVYVNQMISTMLQYSEEDFPLLEVEDVIPGLSLGDLERVSSEGRALGTSLRKKNGEPLNASLTATAIAFMGKTGYILAVRDIQGRILHQQERNQRDSQREHLMAEIQSHLTFLHEPVLHGIGRSASCDLSVPIAAAAELMTRQDCSSILVTAGNETVGIVTDHDIRKRAVAASLPLTQPVFQIMSAPLIGIPHRAAVYEAILLMRERGVQHLVARDDSGRILGVIDNAELLRLHPYSFAVMTQEVQHAGSVESTMAVRRKLPRLVLALLEGGAKPRPVTQAISSITDDVSSKLIQFAVDRLGPPPARFAFLALGSQGRQEQTLASDQDNAILYEDPPESAAAEARRYFLNLGALVCDWLEQAGYPLCAGNVMAKNPKWCLSASAWKRTCSEWIYAAEPQNLLESMTFFDFRVIYGETELAFALRRHIDEELAKEPPFLPHCARYALQYKTPLGFFGQIVVDSAKDHPPTFDIKEALMPVVNFARLYALRNGVHATHTLDRIADLLRLDAVKQSLHDEAVQVYECLMRLRLSHHAAMLGRGEPLQNAINPKILTHMEERLLKEAFAQINNIRRKISYDFFGGA